MKRLTILVPDGQSNLSTVSTIVSTYDIFTTANGYWKKNGRREVFKIELAGTSKEVKYNNGLATLHPEIDIDAISSTNLVIIPPSLVRNYTKADKGNQSLIDWIKQQYK